MPDAEGCPARPVLTAHAPDGAEVNGGAGFGEARRPASAKATAVRRSFSEGGGASGAKAARPVGLVAGESFSEPLHVLKPVLVTRRRVGRALPGGLIDLLWRQQD